MKKKLFLFLFLFLIASSQAIESWKKISEVTPIYGHSSVVFKNKIWVIGENGVNYSEDGIHWKKSYAQPWAPLSFHTSLIYNNKIWIIGGCRSGRQVSEVWSSNDGLVWELVTKSAPWRLSGHTSVVYNNKMWIFGGGCFEGADVTLFNSVWYSEDGINWTAITTPAPWSARNYHASVVFDNKMWILGGNSTNNSQDGLRDVWYSVDGQHWTLATTAFWQGRSGHEVIVHKGQMILIGGEGNTTLRDVWTTKNGKDWKPTISLPVSRTHFSSTIFQGKIWVFAGFCYNKLLQDAWCLEPNSIKFHIPKVTPTMGPRIELSFPSQQNNLHIVASWETEGTAIICTSDVHSTKETSPIILDTSKISKDVGIYLSCSTKPGTVGAKNITLEISGYDNFPDYILYPSINFGQNKDMSVVKYGASFPVPANSVKFLSDYPKFAIVEETVTADNQSWQIELIDRSPFSFGSGTWMWSFKK